MMTWELFVQFGKKNYTLLAEVDGRGAKTMYITVYGMKGTLVFTNNYPALHKAQANNRAMMWSLVKGNIDQTKPEVAKLIVDIIAQLEPLIRNKFPMSMPIF